MFRQRGSMKYNTISRCRLACPSATLRLTLGIVMVAGSVNAQAARDCASLTTVTTNDATITAAAIVDCAFR